MIRRLDPDKDIELYRQCWGWFQDCPAWVKEALAAYSVSTFDEFMELAHGNRADVGVFDSERLVAVISLQLVASGTYEVHLSSVRHPPRTLLLEAIVNVVKLGFEELGIEIGFSFTPSYDKGIIALIRAAGLRQDGVIKLRGTSRGRVVKWIRSIITREDYESNIKAEPDADRFGPILANRDINEYAGSEYPRHQSTA